MEDEGNRKKKKMNLFRFIADSLHLLSFFIIIYKLLRDKNCKGVSAKTQEIYLVVFCTRYLDLFMYFVSFYNTLMKVLFIGVTIFILYLMRFKAPICNTYNREKEDDFPHVYLIPVSLVLTLLIHSEWDWWELVWCFSLWLESLAIFHQVNILAKQKLVLRKKSWINIGLAKISNNIIGKQHGTKVCV